MQMEAGVIGLGISLQFKNFLLAHAGPGSCRKARACPWAQVLFIVTEALCFMQGETSWSNPVAAWEGLLGSLPLKCNYSNDDSMEHLHHL